MTPHLTTYRNDREHSVRWVLPTWAEVVVGTLIIVAALMMLALFASEAPAAPRSVTAVIRHEAKHAKLTRAETAALIVICRRESGYNMRCVTGSYVGLMQIKRTRYNSRMIRYRGKRMPLYFQPHFNVRQAIKVMRKQHGSVMGAKRVSDRTGAY